MEYQKTARTLGVAILSIFCILGHNILQQCRDVKESKVKLLMGGKCMLPLTEVSTWLPLNVLVHIQIAPTLSENIVTNIYNNLDSVILQALSLFGLAGELTLNVMALQLVRWVYLRYQKQKTYMQKVQAKIKLAQDLVSKDTQIRAIERELQAAEVKARRTANKVKRVEAQYTLRTQNLQQKIRALAQEKRSLKLTQQILRSDQRVPEPQPPRGYVFQSADQAKKTLIASHRMYGFPHQSQQQQQSFFEQDQQDFMLKANRQLAMPRIISFPQIEERERQPAEIFPNQPKPTYFQQYY